MTWLEVCRAANVWLAMLAALGVGYRAVIGYHQKRLAWPILYAEFVSALVLIGISFGHAQNINAPTSYLTACWTTLLALIVITCLFHERLMALARKVRTRYGRH